MDLTNVGLIAGIAFVLSLVTQIVNKLTINEKFVEQSRKETKELQEKLKGADPKSKEFSDANDKMIDIQFKLMKMQWKPMMFTFIPYMIVFSFLSSMFAYYPIAVGSTINLEIKGDGHIFSDCLSLDNNIKGTFKEDIKVNSEDCQLTLGSTNKSIPLDSKQILKFEAEKLKATITPEKKIYITFPEFLPLIGGSKLGWLGTFIISSLISSLILSALLKGRQLRKWGDM